MRTTILSLVLLLAACSHETNSSRERASDLLESPSQKRDAVREAFGSASAAASSSAADPIDKGELDAFFTKLGASYRAADAAAIVANWDYSMAVALAEQQGFTLPANLNREKLANGIRDSQLVQLKTMAKYSAWDQHEITRIVNLDPKENDEVQVYLRQYSSVTGATRTRWWLRKRNGVWAVYDFEELTAGLRLSTLLGVGLVAARDKAGWGARAPELIAAIQAGMEGRQDEVEETLKKLSGVTFPPVMQAYLYSLEAAMLLRKGDADGALKKFDLALSLNPEFVSTELSRMTAHSMKGDFKASLEAGRRFEVALGDDADLKYQRAWAHRGLKELTEAERLLKSCLDEVPGHTDCLAELADLLPPARTSELDARLTKVRDFDVTLRETLAVSLDQKQKQGAKALFEAVKRVKPASPVVSEYAPRIKAL